MGTLVKDGFCVLKESFTFESKKCENKLPRSIWETYSAFANSSGGTIVLGFKEIPDGKLKLTGVSEPEKIVRELWDLLHNRNKVNVNLLTDDDVRIMEDDGLQYIIINVPRADRHLRPVFIDNDLNNGTYRRNSDGDYHCTIPEIMEMGRDASEISMDQRIVPDSTTELVDKNTLKNYRDRLRSSEPDHAWLKEDDDEFLRLIGAANYSDGKLMLTQAGLLMFGKITEISHMVPGYNLSYNEYGPNGEWKDRMHSDSGLWSGNVFDFYQETVQKMERNDRKPFELKGDTRIGNNPLVTLKRETLMNALVHADYLGVGGIAVEFDGKKLVVRNPGCFRIPIEKAISGGYSDARNPLMMRMFDLVGLAERQGSGLKTMMRICKENNLPIPVIEEENEPTMVRLTLLLEKNEVPIEEAIMSLMERQPKISIDSIAIRLSVSKSTVARTVNKLKEENKIRREGGLKGEWVISRP